MEGHGNATAPALSTTMAHMNMSTRSRKLGFLAFSVLVLGTEAYYLRGGILRTAEPVVWTLSNILLLH